MTMSAKVHDLKNKRITSMQIPRWLVFLIFLIPIGIYLPGIFGKVPFPSGSALYTDLMLTHYPNTQYLKSSLIEFQQIPLWSTFIHSGAPFAANPLSGLFYLPGWVAMLFPLPEGISIVLAAHAVFATWGMYRFLKEENLGDLGAIAGGLIMGLLPKLAAHYGAGHVSLLYAISWTPWLFLISRKDESGWKTGISSALLFLADPRWAFYAGIIWLTFDIAYRRHKGVRGYILYYLKAGSTAFLIASPLIIPLYEYIGLSTRSNMGVEDILAFSLSPEKILGLVIPTGGSNPEWYLYSGGIVLGLYLFQFFISPLRRKNWFWNSWIVISLAIAFGSWFLNPGWLANIPLISLIRVPARILFLIGFSFSVIAAKTLDYLFSGDGIKHDISKIAFGLTAAAIGLGVPINLILGKFSISAMWGFGFLFLVASIILIVPNREKSLKWAWIIVGLLVIDLFGAGIQSYHLREKELFDQSITARIEENTEKFRIYSPSFSIPQQFAVDNKLELADGIDPLHLAAYSEYLEEASGVKSSGYSVSIPYFSSGNPASDNSDSVPNAFLLSLLNVRFVISDFEINNHDLVEIASNDKLILYENAYSSKRAWVEQSPINEGDYQGAGNNQVSELKFSPNRIEIIAKGPGRLVLSEVQYPGWRAAVDGDPQKIEPVYGLLRSINLPEGEHEIVFTFRPLTVYAGIGMAIVGWVAAIWQISRKRDD